MKEGLMSQTKDEKRIPIALEISLPVLKDKTAPAMRAYLFDGAQRLVESTPVKEQVEFKIDPQQRHRVTVGPDLVVKGNVPPDLVTRLSQVGAMSRDFFPQSPVSKLSFTLLESLVLTWLYVCINIHGTVRKLLNPGGDSPTYAPICTGVVQVFTIDLACSLDNLNDAALLSIKNQALARMLNVEIADLIGMNFADFARVSALAAGLFPLTGNALRSYIVANRATLALFMCNLIPEYAICYQQLPDAPIQSDGTFSLNHCFFFWEAPPDVYFEVVQTIDGVAREVADPDIICTTMWSYDVSQSAQITVIDPSAIACQPDPNPAPGYLYVWPTAIGNIDLRQIDGLETLAGTGLLPGGPNGTAWGGTLSLQIQFDPNLRANNIRYYRWSYKFPSDLNFTQMHASVTHRWMELTFPGGGVIDIHLHPVTLGPTMVSGSPETNLFEIPDPNLPWIDINDPVDRPFAYFESSAASNPLQGLVTLKLEMFDNNGHHVSCGNTGHVGPFKYLLADLSGTPNSFTNAPPPNIDVDGNLIFQVFIDNNPTVAQLQDVTVSGNHVDDCGMLHYSQGSDVVSIQYRATQLNNFIYWDLVVVRGLHGQVAATNGDVNSLNPDFFNNPASQLVDQCVNAAFAVNLNTRARATDGYGRQSQYDRSATIAFALLHP
jgi:hypothetical protein